jgi:hypothetical protein
MKPKRTSATSTTKKHPLNGAHRRLPASMQKRLNVRQFTLCLVGVVIILAGATWLVARDQADSQKSTTNNTATTNDDDHDHDDDQDDGQPKRGKLTLAPTSVTLSKSNPESTSVAISAPVAVGKPAVTPTHYSPINLITQDDAAPPSNSHTVQVALNPNQPPTGTYYVPIQAIHDGPGLRYYYVNLAVHVVK